MDDSSKASFEICTGLEGVDLRV